MTRCNEHFINVVSLRLFLRDPVHLFANEDFMYCKIKLILRVAERGAPSKFVYNSWCEGIIVRFI